MNLVTDSAQMLMVSPEELKRAVSPSTISGTHLDGERRLPCARLPVWRLRLSRRRLRIGCCRLGVTRRRLGGRLWWRL